MNGRKIDRIFPMRYNVLKWWRESIQFYSMAFSGYVHKLEHQLVDRIHGKWHIFPKATQQSTINTVLKWP